MKVKARDARRSHQRNARTLYKLAKLGEPERVDDDRGEKEEPHLRTKVPALSNALSSSFSTEVVDVEKVLPPLVDAEY